MAYAEKTKDWQLYEAGKKYNNSLKPNYYDTVDTNIAFFNGDQWRNLPDNNMPKPVFNIIKRVITFFVASLTSSSVKIQFSPLLYADDSPTLQMQKEYYASEIATSQIENLLEKFKIEQIIRDCYFDAAITGDACLHFYFDRSVLPYRSQFDAIKGEIRCELVDGTNVFFGNANTNVVEKQPYIILSGRDVVKNLREEAKKYNQNEYEIENIRPDKDFQYMAGDAGKLEVESEEYGKALYIITYKRDEKTGRILASKCTENVYIYKDLDTGLDFYPVAWMNWEKQKNQYHGRALCTGMLSNQIFINRMFAMVMYHLMMTAFPKAVYNTAYIKQWTNQIGEAIPVDGAGLDVNIKNIAGYLEPGNMSGQIIQAIELAVQYTKETLGISDVSLGNIRPENTSAIIAVQKSAVIPLENPKANMYSMLEDVARILLDMMGTYYGLRPIVIEKNGQKSIELFDFSVFKNMWLNVKVDVGEASYWSEIASVQTLDNLLRDGLIDIIDYLERIPNGYIPKKDALLENIKRVREETKQNQMQFPQINQSELTPNILGAIPQEE